MSIVKLYAGALFPGLLLAGLYVVYVIVRSMLQPQLAPKPTKKRSAISPRCRSPGSC